ncbi:MAG: hypothetical protein H6744_17650 [Deltaproteobacteria bacterium]|nr:hypothetical protein [Deltaproteobacteria bacterium]
MTDQAWMSWEGGVDLVAMTAAGLPQPNVIVHVARMVHTPVGSAPSGMLLYAPAPDQAPLLMGFISESSVVCRYFGPHVFRGTPFEKAPTLQAKIHVDVDHPGIVSAHVEVEGHIIRARLTDLKPHVLIARPPAEMTPFDQQGLEAEPRQVLLEVDGEQIPVTLPPAGISGGPPAVYSASGLYAR